MTEAHDYFWWWRADASCAQVGGDLFFGQLGDGGAEAKRLCRECPVRLECLIESLVFEDEDGIFGGFGRATRRRLNKQVLDGEDIKEVAAEAIREEKYARATAAARRADSRRRNRARLHEAAGRRPQKRSGVAARRPRAA